MSTDGAGDRGLVGRRILGFLVSDRSLLLVIVVRALAWFAGFLWF